jgi:hypothetical protein
MAINLTLGRTTMENQMTTGAGDTGGYTAESASSCCSPDAQEACCAPEEKAACCGTALVAGGGCGCQ